MPPNSDEQTAEYKIKTWHPARHSAVYGGNVYIMLACGRNNEIGNTFVTASNVTALFFMTFALAAVVNI